MTLLTDWLYCTRYPFGHQVMRCYSVTYGADEDLRYGCDGLSDIIFGFNASSAVVFYGSVDILSGVVESVFGPPTVKWRWMN